MEILPSIIFSARSFRHAYISDLLHLKDNMLFFMKMLSKKIVFEGFKMTLVHFTISLELFKRGLKY